MSAIAIWGARLRTHAEIALWRYGWVWLLVFVTALITVAAQAWWWPQQRRELAAARFALEQARTEQERQRTIAPSALQFTGEDATLAQLSAYSYPDSKLSSILQSITQIAKSEGLVLAQSEFQTSSEGHGGLRQVQLTLPVRATYPQLRLFVEEVLRQLPGVSVDQLGLKRELVAQGQIDIRLKLSIWIDPHRTITKPAQSSALSKLADSPVQQQAAAASVDLKVQP